MVEYFPITPPPELVEQWRIEWCDTDESGTFSDHLATRAAQWGANQFESNLYRSSDYRHHLGLKEQAFMALEDGKDGKWTLLTSSEVSIIRQALELLHD